MLRSIFGAEAERPRLMGPCPGMSWPELATWFPAFLAGVAQGDTVILHCR